MRVVASSEPGAPSRREANSLRSFPRQHTSLFLRTLYPFYASWHESGLRNPVLREPARGPVDSRHVAEGHRAIFLARQTASTLAAALHGGRA